MERRYYCEMAGSSSQAAMMASEAFSRARNSTIQPAGPGQPPAASSEARFYHTMTLLPDGKVLVTGGHNGVDIFASSELYDPATGKWSATGSLNKARTAHTATLLADGKVLVAGGFNNNDLASAELYDPVTGTWTTTGRLVRKRSVHTATLLHDGRVLVAGGSTGTSGRHLASAELYDPTSGTWSVTGSHGHRTQLVHRDVAAQRPSLGGGRLWRPGQSGERGII